MTKSAANLTGFLFIGHAKSEIYTFFKKIHHHLKGTKQIAIK